MLRLPLWLGKHTRKRVDSAEGLEFDVQGRRYAGPGPTSRDLYHKCLNGVPGSTRLSRVARNNAEWLWQGLI